MGFTWIPAAQRDSAEGSCWELCDRGFLHTATVILHLICCCCRHVDDGDDAEDDHDDFDQLILKKCR